MSIVCRSLFSIVLCCSPFAALSGLAQSQATPAPQKLSLTAALVLTPEFCKTQSKKGSEKFKLGKIACDELEDALKGSFASLTSVDDSSKAGNAQVVLEPKFADVGATRGNAWAGAFATRELAVQVEWTVRDRAGKVVWLETVQGSAKRHIGNGFTYRHNLKKIMEYSVQDMAEQSAGKMSSAPQLLALSAQPVK